MNTLYINIKQRRKALGMTQEELAVKAGYTDRSSISKIEKAITEKLRSALGLGVKVHLVNPKTIARSEGKAKRVIDKRKV